MATYYAPGDRICGEAITLRARDIAKTRVVARSGRHQAQQTKGRHDAEAWIDLPLTSWRNAQAGAQATAGGDQSADG